MPAPLDVAALLEPIPGADPAGSFPVPFAIEEQLKQARIEVDDPDLPPEAQKKADWRGLVELAQETLRNVSKDLWVAARLTEGLVRLHGYAGLHTGLSLLRQLVEVCWDRLRPPLDDGNADRRAAPFAWLNDPGKGAYFPSTLRLLPLVWGPQGDYSWNDWSKSQKNRGEVTREMFEQAMMATPWETSSAVVADITLSQEELAKLGNALTEKMGPAAPGLTAVSKALEEVGGLAREILRRKGPEPVAETDIPAETAEEQPGVTGQAARAPATRAEAYQQLARAAAILRDLEPHSPIPYLIQRAVELGSLPFPQLIKALIRDVNVLTELNRELGIKEPPSE